MGVPANPPPRLSVVQLRLSTLAWASTIFGTGIYAITSFSSISSLAKVLEKKHPSPVTVDVVLCCSQSGMRYCESLQNCRRALREVRLRWWKTRHSIASAA
jgi:hypothetical protein